MREKYIEERFPRWMIFGEHPTKDLVDVSEMSCNCGDMATVTREQASILIRDRDNVIDMLVKLAQALDKIDSDLFDEIWYGKQ